MWSKLWFSLTLSLLVLQFSKTDCEKYTNPRNKPNSSGKHTRNPIFDFSTNLYLTVSKFKNADENMLISPFSIRSVCALIYIAARGQTAEEIRNALLLPSDHADLIEGLTKQMASTQIAAQSKFDVGNGVFLREGTVLNQTFSRIVRNQLLSEVLKTPFGEPQKAAKIINDWVSRVTRQKITNLIDSSSLSPGTSVFMANALYFSGQWEKPFDEVETKHTKFYLSSGGNVTVPMMQIENSFPYNYIKELGASAISLPFKDSRFEFIILKPDESIPQLEQSLRNYPMNLLSSQIKTQNRSVFLQMPRFRLNVHYDLVDVMKRLGIRALFDNTKADISGLTKSGDHHFVSDIVHQTVLDINEKGAAAAAGTTVSVYPISSPSYFVIDRPFLFVLNDRLTGPVFIGRLENPLASRTPEALKDRHFDLSPR